MSVWLAIDLAKGEVVLSSYIEHFNYSINIQTVVEHQPMLWNDIVIILVMGIFVRVWEPAFIKEEVNQKWVVNLKTNVIVFIYKDCIIVLTIGNKVKTIW